MKIKRVSSVFVQLNASDDRGIDVVRGPVLSFASTRTIFKYEQRWYYIIILYYTV